MTDVLSPEQRRRNMSQIKGKNTTSELGVRKELWRRGYRYRLHKKGLPGRPDIVLNRFKAVIFVNGCFWHRHECHLFKWPKTRTEFWKEKINKNADRDKKNYQALIESGYKVMVIWECSLKGKSKIPMSEIADVVEGWLISDEEFKEI